MRCKLNAVLAYSGAIYIMACALYIALTRDLGTPFRDSLTKDQIKILQDAKANRRRAFLTGIVVSTIVIILTRPFGTCTC